MGYSSLKDLLTPALTIISLLIILLLRALYVVSMVRKIDTQLASMECRKRTPAVKMTESPAS